MNELFLFGDPRYLSGAADVPQRLGRSYGEPIRSQSDDVTVITTNRFTTPGITFCDCPAKMLRQFYPNVGIYKGKEGYHGHRACNVFVLDGKSRTAGVELEMFTRRNESLYEVDNATASNWFWFENDGSLHGTPNSDEGEGYELITHPLPPEKYLDPRLWTALENLLAPYFTSWKNPSTGLHVHVGFNSVVNLPGYAAFGPNVALYVAKMQFAALYYAMPRKFVDRVFLRRPTTFSNPSREPAISSMVSAVTRGTTLDGLAELAILVQRGDGSASDNPHPDNQAHVARVKNRLYDQLSFAEHGPRLVESQQSPHYPWGLGSHGVEVNLDNHYTAEIRRGKGTVNGNSIHRMVCFADLLVRFIENRALHGGPVNPKAVMAFMAENSENKSLARMAEEEKGN